MSRWIVEPGTGKLVPAEEFYARREAGKHGSGAYVMPDISPFQSPLDYSAITSRSQIREHEKRHGVRQCGELKAPQDFDNSERRGSAFNEKRFEVAYKQALDRTGAL